MRELVLVTGATGKQGGAVARALLDKGFRVRALTRDPSNRALQSLVSRGAEIAVGDLDDSATLRRALNRVDGVFTYGVYSAQAAHETGRGSVGYEVEQGCRLVDLAYEAKISYFVYGSVASADRHTGVPHFDTKGQVEQHIHDIGLPATILRPVFFMQNWERLRAEIMQTGALTQPLRRDTQHCQISVQDIAAFAARVFSTPERWIGRAAELCGDVLTMEETAQTMSRVLARDIDYVQEPWHEFENRQGRESTLMFRFFEERGFEADPVTLRSEIPTALTLEGYLRSADWGARADP